jgi:methylated-DNA-[protein]-cysteine S-methyltransferase
MASLDRFDAVVAFPAMRVAICTDGDHVAEVRYLPPDAQERAPRNALAERAVRQLERYREDPDALFDLPIAPQGTPFQLRVWEALMRISRGNVKTYGALAHELGGEARAVGQACGDNRLPIVIPCHRVVAADGLGGFAHSRGGFLIEAKSWLLAHEKALLI